MDINQFLTILHNTYPNPKTELENWKNGIQFLVCVILSAQATDKGVNKISAKLFEKYITVKDFANADIEELQKHLSSINYYKMKSQRIINASKYILENFNGEIPKSIEELIRIPGIGRKSANVILIEVFGLAQGVVVDTHITRVSNRLGLTTYNDQKDAEKIEEQLKDTIPSNEWGFYSSSVVLHGRYICKAKKTKCDLCPFNKICPSAYVV